MKRFKLGKTLLYLSAIFYIIYNTHYGWNLFPESTGEKLCDGIYVIIFLFGIVLYLYPLLIVYENMVKDFYLKKDKEKNNGISK